jgi:acetyltransferase-like isoleucine patch superfamily enzyme
MRKLGAMLGDRAEIGCGCVLNPGTIVGKNSRIYPLTSVRGTVPQDCILKSSGEITPIKNE